MIKVRKMLHSNMAISMQYDDFFFLFFLFFRRFYQIGRLHEDNKALERHIKSKELALLEAERILRSALERALIVEEVQNQNFELKRQIEICQAQFNTRSSYV